MNAIILSAVLGVVMMFSGIYLKSNAAIRMTAIAGLVLLLAVNIAELYGFRGLSFDSRNMLAVTSFSLVFNSIAFACTLLFFCISGRDIENVGSYVAEYFALIFFVLCGVSIASCFNT